MVSDGKKSHYLTVTKLSVLLREITSTNHQIFYYLNCLHSFRTENKYDLHEKFCKNHKYCKIVVPNDYTKILKYCYGEKSIRHPFVIYEEFQNCLERYMVVKTILKNPAQHNKCQQAQTL